MRVPRMEGTVTGVPFRPGRAAASSDPPRGEVKPSGNSAAVDVPPVALVLIRDPQWPHRVAGRFEFPPQPPSKEEGWVPGSVYSVHRVGSPSRTRVSQVCVQKIWDPRTQGAPFCRPSPGMLRGVLVSGAPEVTPVLHSTSSPHGEQSIACTR